VLFQFQKKLPVLNYQDLCEYPIEKLSQSDLPIVIDTETMGETRESNIPIYYSWCARDLEAGAGPVTTPNGFNFLDALCTSKRPKIFHNAKFDLRMLNSLGFTVNGEIHDTILMHALLDEHHLEYHSLKALSSELLNRPREDAITLKDFQRSFPKAVRNLRTPQRMLHQYAVNDAIDPLDLYDLFVPQLHEQNLWELYRNEVAAELVYKEIDSNGVCADTTKLANVPLVLDNTLKELESQIFAMFGCLEFNIRSGKQLGKVLIAEGFPLKEKTPHGEWKTSKSVLEPFRTDKRIQAILAYKFLSKAKSTLVGYARLVGTDGRFHPDYRQTTTTGRSACSDPNLQNIPKQRGKIDEVEIGDAELAIICANAFRQVRSIFCTPPGAMLVSWDYSQVEYRMAAHYSGSERLIAELSSGGDFHEMMCRLVFGEYNSRLRHILKILSYGLLYGLGVTKLLLNLQVEKVENPRGVINLYETRVPEMRQLQRMILHTGQSRGYVVDVFSRRYRIIPERPYALVSALCQGSAANIKKFAMVRVQELLKGKRSKLVMDIHDQLVVETYPEDAELIPLVKEVMEDFPQFSLPIVVDVEVGPNLLDLEEMVVEKAVELVKGVK